jgi:peptidoglycan/LPS O-acetylase OafA/YrhL
MKPKPRVEFVDGLRTLAVLSVLVFHAAITGTQSFANWEFCGARGVTLFFVISGFCLAFPFLHAWRESGTLAFDRADYGTFMLRRFSRIAPPYYVVLTIFVLLSLTPFGIPIIYPQHLGASTAAHEYLTDLAFLTSSSPLYNPSFWTLGVEARWYLLCPLLVLLYVRSRIAFAAVGIAMAVLYALPNSIGDEGTLPAFMLGIVACDLVLADVAWLRFAWIPAALALTLAVIEQSRVAQGDAGDPYWYVASFFLVLAAARGPFRRLLEMRPIAAVGIASYSIYLVHGPFVETFVRVGIPRPIAAIAALGVGFAAYYAIEVPLSNKSSRRRIEAIVSAPARALSSLRLVPKKSN